MFCFDFDFRQLRKLIDEIVACCQLDKVFKFFLATHHFFPVEPKPFVPRSVSERMFTLTGVGLNIGQATICAIRSNG